jgi:hypothetical protein
VHPLAGNHQSRTDFIEGHPTGYSARDMPEKLVLNVLLVWRCRNEKLSKLNQGEPSFCIAERQVESINRNGGPQ